MMARKPLPVRVQGNPLSRRIGFKDTDQARERQIPAALAGIANRFLVRERTNETPLSHAEQQISIVDR